MKLRWVLLMFFSERTENLKDLLQTSLVKTGGGRGRGGRTWAWSWTGEIFWKLIPSGNCHNCQPPQQGGWKGGEKITRDQTRPLLLACFSFKTDFIFSQNIPSHFSLFSGMKNSHFLKVNPTSEKYILEKLATVALLFFGVSVLRSISTFPIQFSCQWF